MARRRTEIIPQTDGALVSMIFNGRIEWFAVDCEDIGKVRDRLWRGIAGPKDPNKVYVRGRVCNNQVLLHRFLLEVIGKDVDVDHIDGNTRNNRRSNLRVCSTSNNASNQIVRCDSLSGYKGVGRNNRSKLRPWIAKITSNKKRITIGTFPDITTAAKAYDDAARKYHGEYARLNFPSKGEQSCHITSLVV